MYDDYEPLAKRSKLGNGTGTFVLYKLKGRTAPLRIDRISKFIKDRRIYLSASVHVRGFDWRLNVGPIAGKNDGLNISMVCDGSGSQQGSGWSCVASGTLVFYTSGKKITEMNLFVNKKFDKTSPICRFELSISKV